MVTSGTKFKKIIYNNNQTTKTMNPTTNNKGPNPGQPVEFVRNGEVIGIMQNYQEAIFIFNSICTELMHKYPDLFKAITFTLKQGDDVFKRC